MKKLLVSMLTMALCIMPITVYAMSSAEDDTEAIYSVEPEGYNDTDIMYHYEMVYGSEQLVGLYYNDEYYQYLYDESGVIKGICDENWIQVVSYTYDESEIVSGVYSYENGMWITNNDEHFVGNRNKMLWLGLFYDEVTQCYYIGDRYYNTVTGRYMDGHSDDSILTDKNPFLYTEEGIMLVDSYIEESASEWAESLLSSGNYGTPIGYSSNWYTSLSDVELLARAIFAEGGTAYTQEEDAVARVILNRVNSPEFPNTNSARAVVTSGEFAAITGGSSGRTKEARVPIEDPDNVTASNKNRWEHSTFLACLLCTTDMVSEWEEIVADRVGNRLFFYSYKFAQDGYNEGSCIFSGSGDDLKYGSIDIKHVYVMGYGNVTSFSDLFTSYYPIDYSRNIYYNYE